MTALVSGIVEDARELLKQQFELFKHEVRDDVRKIRVAMLALGVAAGIGFVGTLLLGITLGLLLNALLPALPLWASFGIVTAVFLLVCGGLCALSFFKLRSIDPLNNETAEALKENVQWITKPK